MTNWPADGLTDGLIVSAVVWASGGPGLHYPEHGPRERQLVDQVQEGKVRGEGGTRWVQGGVEGGMDERMLNVILCGWMY